MNARLLLLLLTLSTPALAQDAWHSELRLSIPIDAQSASGTDTTFVSPRVTGTWFFRPVRDDLRTPLALLPFFQHTGSFTASFEDALNTQSSTSAQTFSVGGTAYVARRLGLTASSGVTLTAANGTNTTFDAGVLAYLTPRARLSLEYLGTRNRNERLTTSAFSGGATSTNRAQLGLFAVLAQDVASLSLTGEVGHIGTSSQVVNASGLSAATSEGTLWSASGAVTGYFTRALSLAVEGGFRGQSRSGFSNGVPVDTTVSDPFVGPRLEWFATPSAFVTAAYQFEDDHTTNTLGRDSRVTSHTVTLSIGVRN